MFPMPQKLPTKSPANWTFLSNHAHVLICIARNPDVRISEIAELVGIRERAAHRIIHELEVAGYLSVEKDGRNNTYIIDLNQPLRHPLESRHHIGAVLQPLIKKVRN
jgi:DNA-binding IclR family transcriptional regulator